MNCAIKFQVKVLSQTNFSEHARNTPVPYRRYRSQKYYEIETVEVIPVLTKHNTSKRLYSTLL